jgi:hypothetical protein
MQKSQPNRDAAPKKPSKSAPRVPERQNEGEGSRSAARRYDAGAERAASNPKRVNDLAKKAEQAIDGSEGKELREAEERGKKGSHH